ncbi:hypothetical protein IFR05_007911 [Cadophora sp. M221]|nr:hypothetical protein IFR05_007911 [Cadophora sp. M221]
MGRRASPNEDVWFGVDDAKKRKKIQDRLAQRARRDRIAQRKSQSQSPSTSPGEDIRLLRMQPAVTSRFPSSIAPSSIEPISLDHALLPLPQHTIYSAMFHNGVILGLACASSSVSVSQPALPHVPESLRPTKMQLQHVHFQWIDRFPMPEFRDKMITCTDSLSIEGFLSDLFTLPSFVLVPGSASWDPGAWFATDDFQIFWADKLLALKEGGLPYEVDSHTLDTKGYDPFGHQIKSKTFTAHPKVDPFTEELVVFGYEAKGLATRDIATYTLDKEGRKTEELWLQSPWCAAIHDSIITENWLVLVLWPFESNMERLRAKKQHWAWNYDLKATFIVVPRRQSTVLPDGWRTGETRFYEWKNCMNIHTAGGWEGQDGTIYLETTRVHDNAFPFFPPDDGRMPSSTKADFVRWKLDLTAPSGSVIPDPELILDMPCEFPRIDERFMTKQHNVVFLDVFLPDRSDAGKNIFHGLNELAMHDYRMGKTRFFYAGDGSMVQEPIFIPRTEDAEEGDGWVIAMIERRLENRCDLVVIDTQEFESL